MSLLAIILILISALFHALRNLAVKQSEDKQVFTLLYTSFGLALEFPLFLYYFVDHIPEHAAQYLICIFSGFVHFAYYIYLARTYEIGELSHVYPITRSAPAPITLFAVLLLGEHISFLGGVGISLVVLGIYIISFEQFSLKKLASPFRHLVSDKAIQLAFLTLIVVTTYSLVDKVGVDAMHPVVFAFLHLAFAVFFQALYVFICDKSRFLLPLWRCKRRSVISASIFGVFGYFLVLMAMSLEQVSYVSGLRQMSIVFAVLLGGHVLKEKNQSIRRIAALIIVIGSFLIAIAK